MGYSVRSSMSMREFLFPGVTFRQKAILANSFSADKREDSPTHVPVLKHLSTQLPIL